MVVPTPRSTERTPRSAKLSSKFTSEESDQTFNTCELPITEIPTDIFERVFGSNWARKSHEVFSFRSERYDLTNINFMKELPISNLYTLDLSYNSIENLSGIDQLAMQLKVLNASHNKLCDFVTTFPRLEELHLDHNDLECLPPVSGLPKYI